MMGRIAGALLPSQVRAAGSLNALVCISLLSPPYTSTELCLRLSLWILALITFAFSCVAFLVLLFLWVWHWYQPMMGRMMGALRPLSGMLH